MVTAILVKTKTTVEAGMIPRLVQVDVNLRVTSWAATPITRDYTLLPGLWWDTVYKFSSPILVH